MEIKFWSEEEFTHLCKEALLLSFSAVGSDHPEALKGYLQSAGWGQKNFVLDISSQN